MTNPETTPHVSRRLLPLPLLNHNHHRSFCWRLQRCSKQHWQSFWQLMMPQQQRPGQMLTQQRWHHQQQEQAAVCSSRQHMPSTFLRSL